MKKKKFAYLFFHLNLFFSSLPENKRKEVIKKCYWPLLNLIDKSNFNIGVEITGWTLKEINKLDQKWIIFFKKLLKQNKTYLIGSSYTQAIFPLIPCKVNDFNIRYGNQIYKRILNYTPKIAYVNEQCYSKSIVDLYKKNNYQALIIDWDSLKNNVNKKYKYSSQKLKGNKYSIDVIWNSSNNFQNFQKVIHSKLSLEEYFKNFYYTNSFSKGLVCIYGSDAEIFDFRLKRFENETTILNKQKSEWNKIKTVLDNFKKNFFFLDLNEIVEKKSSSKNKKNLINATKFENILITKKQKKYNPLRWFVGGRDNYTINTICWRIYLYSKQNTDLLKKLCLMWSSDFRTHIELKRWNTSIKKLKKESAQLNRKNYASIILDKKTKKNFLTKENFFIKKNSFLKEDDNSIHYNDSKNFFIIDKKMGLNLQYFGLIKNKKYLPYIVKYNQGYFDDNKLNADFYNGHNVVENSNLKFSDLDKQSQYKIEQKNNFLIISSRSNIKETVDFQKKWYFDLNKKILFLHNKIKLFKVDFFSIRNNFFNLNHQIFNLKDLNLSTSNGGYSKEIFELKNCKSFFDDEPISSKFSANNCFGNTDGDINFYDKNRHINFKIFPEVGVAAPMFCFKKFKNNLYFLRLLTSFRENNDVKMNFKNKKFESLISIQIKK